MNQHNANQLHPVCERIDDLSTMKNALTLLGLCMMLLACTSNSMAQTSMAQTENRGFIVNVGDAMPNFVLNDLDGQVHTNESLLGQVYVLQFTASWCSVCRAEMPHLESEVWQEFQDRDFMLLGVDLDEPRDKIANFTQQMGVSYPMCPDSAGTVFCSIAAPKSGVTRNVVVDRGGRIAMLTRLFDKEEFARMVETIDALTSSD